MQKFSVKVDVSLVNDLTLSLRSSEDEDRRLGLGVANAQTRASQAWERVSDARIAVRQVERRLGDVASKAAEDVSLALLLAPLEAFAVEARAALEDLEAEFEAEQGILRALEAKSATNRRLLAALEISLEMCEVAGADRSPVDETGGWSSTVW